MLEMLTTFDEKEYLAGVREEAIAEGRAEGRAEEQANTEREKRRADAEKERAEAAEAELARYREKYGDLI